MILPPIPAAEITGEVLTRRDQQGQILVRPGNVRVTNSPFRCSACRRRDPRRPSIPDRRSVVQGRPSRGEHAVALANVDIRSSAAMEHPDSFVDELSALDQPPAGRPRRCRLVRLVPDVTVAEKHLTEQRRPARQPNQAHAARLTRHHLHFPHCGVSLCVAVAIRERSAAWSSVFRAESSSPCRVRCCPRELAASSPGPRAVPSPMQADAAARAQCSIRPANVSVCLRFSR